MSLKVVFALVSRTRTPKDPLHTAEKIMDDKKLDVKSSADGDVSAGETTMLSKDEQHLAKLGYKQGKFVQKVQQYGWLPLGPD